MTRKRLEGCWRRAAGRSHVFSRDWTFQPEAAELGRPTEFLRAVLRGLVGRQWPSEASWILVLLSTHGRNTDHTDQRSSAQEAEAMPRMGGILAMGRGYDGGRGWLSRTKFERPPREERGSFEPFPVFLVFCLPTIRSLRGALKLFWIAGVSRAGART